MWDKIERWERTTGDRKQVRETEEQLGWVREKGSVRLEVHLERDEAKKEQQSECEREREQGREK